MYHNAWLSPYARPILSGLSLNVSISKYEPLKTKLNIKGKIIFVVYNFVLKLRIKLDNRK